MTTPILKTVTSLVAVMALAAVLVLPLCGGLLSTHVCPMEMAMQAPEGDCNGPAGPGIKRQAMDCCIAPQAGTPPAVPSAPLLTAVPAPLPGVSVLPNPVIAEAIAPSPAISPRPLDLFSIHSSLLL